MKKYALFAAFLLIPCSCALLPGGSEEYEGIPVAQASSILRGIADDIELWDANKDGLIDGGEYLPLGLAVTSRILLALQAAEPPLPEAER